MSRRSAPAALAASLSDQRGFSLVEAVAGTALAILAIVALAHTFATGRGLIDRYEVARAALGVAQRRLEILTTRPPASLVVGQDSTLSFVFKGQAVGVEFWSVRWVDERIDSLGGSDLDGNPNDTKRVQVRVSWGSAFDADTVRLERLFPAS